MMARPRAPKNIWTGHVALSPADKEAFDRLGELRPAIFDYPGVCGAFIPLDVSVEAAMETALLQCTSAMFEATASDTTLHVLRVSFIGEVARDMCMAGELRWGAVEHRLEEDTRLDGRLRWSAARHRLELRAAIKAEWLSRKSGASSPQVEVIEVVLPRMYFDDWGDWVLSAQWSLQKSQWRMQCEQCPNWGRFTWKADPSYGGGRFCAECWHGYCKNAGYIRGSLHEPPVQEKALPQLAANWSADWSWPDVEAESSDASDSPCGKPPPLNFKIVAA